MYIIAEIGVNHDGSLAKAFRLIDEAIKAGADCVKFQSFKAERLALSSTPKVEYQKRDTSSQSHLEMLQKLQLSIDEMSQIIKYCHKLGIDFLSTPYDVNSATELKELGVRNFKVASADVVDYHLNKYLASFAENVFMSTGMASEAELKRVLKLYRAETSLTLLHCTSSYPTNDEDVNLLKIRGLKEKFSLPVGFSDHSVDDIAALAAQAMGCNVVEKHFTLNKFDDGPDHAASEDPSAFARLVTKLRRLEVMMGVEEFVEVDAELAMKSTSRKSLHWTTNKSEGSVVEASDFTAIRPNDGLDPFLEFDVIGRCLKKAVEKNQPVSLDDLI